MRTLLTAYALHVCTRSDLGCITKRVPQTPLYHGIIRPQIQEFCQHLLCSQGLRLGAHSSCERPPIAQIHESTYQYHPSLIPEGPHTCLIRPPKGPRVLCCCFQPRPGRVCPETAHLPDTRSTSTAQHSSTDPAHLYLPCSQTCPPSLSPPPSS